VIDARRVARFVVGDEAPAEERSATCLNCGTALAGPFCSQCGQRDVPPYPSVRELVVDAFWELSGWDGRFASTVRALVRRPGVLTREFLEGRRARYLSPLRLYLMASLAYFVISAAAPQVKTGSTINDLDIHYTTTQTGAPAVTSAPERVGDVVKKSLDIRDRNADPDPDPISGKTNAPLSAEEKAAALKDVARAPAFLRPLVRRAIDDPAGLKRGILDMMPRMLFVLLPVFAGIVALFYRGRKYPEHLYFAIHLHAFIFLALALTRLVRFTHSPKLVSVAGIGAMLWIPIYATLAFRQAYGGGMIRTLAKEIGIGTIYLTASFAALLLTVYAVALYG
jgi:hypothetical protein